MSDYLEACKQATALAQSSSGGSLPSIASRYFPEIKANGKTTTCPFCQKSGDKFGIHRSKSGGWYWGCHYTGCEAHFENIKKDAIGLISFMEKLEYKDAVKKLCEYANVQFPEKEDYPSKVKKKAKPIAEVVVSDEEDEVVEPTVISAKQSTSTLIKIPDEGRTIYEEIWLRISLSDQDRKQLHVKRGLSDHTIDTLGFRSSVKDNDKALDEVLMLFPEDELLATGVAKIDKRSGKMKLNPQLTGWGIKKRGSGNEADEWDWVNPILIPYIDFNGRITSLRPHKGGLSGVDFLKSSGYSAAIKHYESSVHPYCPALLNDRDEVDVSNIVLTEGEFKAAALWQVGIPCLAVPGIQMTRNSPFLKELVDTLRKAGVKNVTVIYDKEDKSHKADPFLRYETDVYARYACHALSTEMFYTKYGELPDSWMEDGKADWDGYLAKLAKTTPADKLNEKAHKEFSQVIRKAKTYSRQLEFFPTEERQRIIQCRLLRLTHEPNIKIGSDEQMKQAKIISKCHVNFINVLGIWDLRSTLISCNGCYYDQKPYPKDLKAHYIRILKEIDEMLDTCSNLTEKGELMAAKVAAQIHIAGRIEVISDFTMHCEYTVRTRENTVERLLRFKNVRGESSELVQPTNSSLATSSKFREFCYSTGAFNFKGGDKHLQGLMEDLATYSAYREIRELNHIGYDHESKQYIFADCAFSDSGEVNFPDESNIIWKDGVGYRVDPSDLDEFAHKNAPQFYQELGVPAEVQHRELMKRIDDELKEVSEIGFIFSINLYHSFGDFGGWLAMGVMMGYAFSPELVKKYKGHPGLWVAGRMGSGKTETTRLLMQIWGYGMDYSIPTMGEGTTPVGLDRILSQYSSMPLHLDEFRESEANKNKIASVRNAFNRQSKNKGKLDQTNRTRAVQPMTMPIITGEGSTTDAATKSRFVNLVLAASRRLGTQDEQAERYNSMMGSAGELHRIGRILMIHRKEFANRAMKHLEDWLKDSEVIESTNTARLRLTYGYAYAAFVAFAEVVLKDPDQMAIFMKKIPPFKKFTINAIQTESSDVTKINFISKFWRGITSLYERHDDIKHFMTFEPCSFDEHNRATRFNYGSDGSIPEGCFPCVLIQIDPVYSEYAADARKSGDQAELSIQNLRAEMQKEPYWMPAPTVGTRAHRLKLSDKSGYKSTWILRYDRMDDDMQSIFNDYFAPDNNKRDQD